MKNAISLSLLALLGFVMNIASLPRKRSEELREINRRLDSIGCL